MKASRSQPPGHTARRRQPAPPTVRRTIRPAGERILLLVGGIGKLEPMYRRSAESRGWLLCHHEKGSLRAEHAAQPDLILVMVSCCAHPLRDAAEELAVRCRVPIDHLRTPSVSALVRALDAAADQERNVHADAAH